MRTYRDREKRLAQLEAQAGRGSLGAPDDDMPPYWYGCMVCGNVSDPRQLAEVDPRCAWCGAAADQPATSGPLVCPQCGDVHAIDARPASEWSRAGACPVCQFAPPPTDSQPIARYEAWMRAMGISTEEG